MRVLDRALVEVLLLVVREVKKLDRGCCLLWWKARNVEGVGLKAVLDMLVMALVSFSGWRIVNAILDICGGRVVVVWRG